jgi:hypothetical protein
MHCPSPVNHTLASRAIGPVRASLLPEPYTPDRSSSGRLDPIEQPIEKDLWRRHGLVEATITISIYDPCRRRPYVPENHRKLKTLYFVPKMSSRRIPLRSHMPLKMPPAL